MSIQQLLFGGKNISTTPTVLFLTSGTSWTVPSDWNNTIDGPGGYKSKVEVIGGGGGGGKGDVDGGCGGGGGAYSRIDNLSLTIGSSIPYSVGATVLNGTNGANTWFNGTSISSASVSAAGGLKGGNDGGTPGVGGQASAGIGTTKYSGGTGGDGNDTWAGSGGGAAGPGGNGGNGAVGNPATTPGGAGASGSWTSNPGGVTVNPGSGGLAGVSDGVGQPGNVYGGGGGGGDDDGDRNGGNGAQGIIIISYYPFIN